MNALLTATGKVGCRWRERSLPVTAETVRPTVPPFPAADSFLVMVAAFYPNGGLVTSDELLLRLRLHCDQPISLLARWIVTRQAVSFSWQSQTLVPMFQFDPDRMTLLPGPRRITQELAGAFDDWDVASWYSQPNSWLAGSAPVDCVAASWDSVLDAARADRFIAAG